MNQANSNLPTISVILPAFNEEALLREHVDQILSYMTSIEDRYEWELLIINDGSTDRTGPIANQLANDHDNVRVLHHPRNFGLGQVLKFGFANARGDYIVTLDVDLSYDPRHIAELVDTIQRTHAKIVLASPYMQGGTIQNVPFLRRTLSVLGNKFLSLLARGHWSTLTSMVRVYDGPFIRSLDLRSVGMDIMPEMIYKAMVLRARIDEIPGRLDWAPQRRYGDTRASSMRLIRHVASTVLSGFVFRPFLFFIVPGLIVGAFALYVDTWMFVHFFSSLEFLKKTGIDVTYSKAFKHAYSAFPHTFVTALLSTMLSIQLVGLGVMALQNKRYFEDLFHLGSAGIRKLKQPME